MDRVLEVRPLEPCKKTIVVVSTGQIPPLRTQFLSDRFVAPVKFNLLSPCIRDVLQLFIALLLLEVLVLVVLVGLVEVARDSRLVAALGNLRFGSGSPLLLEA